MNVSWLNPYQIPSRNYDPLKYVSFVSGAYFPYMVYYEVFEKLL